MHQPDKRYFVRLAFFVKGDVESHEHARLVIFKPQKVGMLFKRGFHSLSFHEFTPC
jgi:hypothetical protein